MTQLQVQTLSNQELNRKLAELMGYTVYYYDKDVPENCYYMLVDPDGDYSGIERPSEGMAWLDAPWYVGDPAASLEVQAKALELNYKAYIDHLDECVNTDELTICSEPSYRAIASLLLASPRERAEAAYVTIQGEK
ncbi:hypothetical protein CA600_12595 [Paenibacillus sp. VTT E-133280]|uniref:hypothetical protein n=1 Tax=Paenibacillus sp. VTT E-133280 TaxID=1986222 RepID=UPI000BA0697B|nr:hypothetical protein [Paenibacillus sp. VTT E-133280]OZQ66092.1 hypothetical protein CA600_12595 [Paenibacillus sp. VTT E-133280]